MININENNEITKDEYRAILVGLETEEDISYYMEELGGLAEAAGIEVAGEMVQVRKQPNKSLYIGKGKVEELALMCEKLDVNLVVFNDELSGTQLRNLEDRLGVRVIDRTTLILDIFASRAVSKEGKLQVELAQLQYRLPRLTGLGKSLSRLGGGIGTRGPGEKKLESDRRHIRRRITDIKKEIEGIKKTRKTQRARREKTGIPLVALVGYTNSGKSAVMNRLLKDAFNEDKLVAEKDMLFATLDTFQRNIKLSNNNEFILIDTVGFVSNLPHSLVDAFKATLEEVYYADLLLHIVDASYRDYEFHIEVTNDVINQIWPGYKDKILVYNKIDLLDSIDRTSMEGQNSVCISAKTGENIDELLRMIEKRLFSQGIRTALIIPYDRGEIASDLCYRYNIEKTEYRNEGTYMEVELSYKDYQRLENFMV
ncbi:MAG: GTPase HflX [Clostridiales bacterium]|jgi:GTP-binding protein HflX|nr:GTPase HflX [Clostridiales bacterium]